MRARHSSKVIDEGCGDGLDQQVVLMVLIILGRLYLILDEVERRVTGWNRNGVI